MASSDHNQFHNLTGTHEHNGKITPLKSVTVEETPEQRYARTHPAEHRGISGCCDSALNPASFED